jgi:ATP-dependent helicase/nuclease subunit A
MTSQPQKKQFNKKALDPDFIQRQASDPKASVWLTANAGTGKTKVLTDRVLRLLLDGSAPEDILCVTFTTAAAALMQKRIREELSIWTTCTDKMLDTQLKKLVGTKPDVNLRNHARQLFARFLEAPEGIKIQTIHSLSQTLIGKFPIESGVPPSFKVMDAEDSLSLLRESQAEVLNSVQEDPESKLAAAVKMITPEVGEAEFVSLVNDIVMNRKMFRQTIAHHGSLDAAIESVYDYLETDHKVSGGQLRFQMGDESLGAAGDPPDLEALRAAATTLSTGAKSDVERADMLNVWLDASPAERNLMFKEYLGVFMTANREVRKRLATQKCVAAQPALEAEAERLTRVLEKIKSANVARGTEALMVLGDAVLSAYEKRKKALNYLDYDDLIHKADELLSEDRQSSWVLRKLPGNLQHILVDEAQDTSPEQWNIVESLMKSFLKDPEKKSTKDRTLFVVGDQKQSIFSFQGADPIEFARRKALFEKLVSGNGGTWRTVDMDITFRSSAAVLDAVDAVFAREFAARGVQADDDKPVKHRSFRKGQGGVVELNPITQGGQDTEEFQPWSIPDQMGAVSDPALDLAEQIADRIKSWLDKGEKLESRNRPIHPGDIMILVRRRSAFVDHVVRALKKRDVPVAGVDRMVLNEQIAVQDLLALGEVLLHPTDDYKLAVVLKSPLFGMTDKQLENLALDRPGSLWEALEKKSKSRAKSNAIYKKSFKYLDELQEQLKTDGTYKFYSNVLMRSCPASEKSGLSAIYKRLGAEAEDPMVEFLNALERFERDNPPSLQTFIGWLNAGEAEVKREIGLNSAQPKVGIMTVHGAKGLEAPIVVLPDTTGIPTDNIRARPRLLWPEGERTVPLWVPNSNLENEVFKREKQIIEDMRDNEYRRLLYVAMTRAADRLYVFGHQNRDSLRELSWYSMMAQGLIENLGDKLNKESLDNGEIRLSYKVDQTTKSRPDGQNKFKKMPKMALPVWARTSPEPEPEDQGRFTPSKVGAKKPQSGHDNDNAPSLPSPLAPVEDNSYRFKYGNASHNLLEFLPLLPVEKRETAAKAYLAQPALDLTQKQQETILKQVNTVLDNPEFEFMFGPDSRAEVTIAGNVMVNGENRKLNGQIDRLAIDGDDVWIIDYKSNAKIPERPRDTPDLYVAQMAAYKHVIEQIYPDKTVKCALLWTRAAKLQVLTAPQLKKAGQDLGIIPKAAPKKPTAKKPAAKNTAPKRRKSPGQ